MRFMSMIENRGAGSGPEGQNLDKLEQDLVKDIEVYYRKISAEAQGILYTKLEQGRAEIHKKFSNLRKNLAGLKNEPQNVIDLARGIGMGDREEDAKRIKREMASGLQELKVVE